MSRRQTRQKRFHEHKIALHNSYSSYKNGGVGEGRILYEIEKLMHTAWKNYDE